MQADWGDVWLLSWNAGGQWNLIVGESPRESSWEAPLSFWSVWQMGAGPTYARSVISSVVSWNRTLPTEARFIVLANFNSEAVLDQDTGLLWERSPSTARTDWKAARSSCLNKAIGGRRGWRLPSIVELTSLLDPSVQDSEAMLPAGHPFLNNPAGFYWSASADRESSRPGTST